MSAPESAEAPSTRAGPGRWTTVLRSHVGYIPGRSRCVRGVCFKRKQTKRRTVLRRVLAQAQIQRVLDEARRHHIIGSTHVSCKAAAILRCASNAGRAHLYYLHKSSSKCNQTSTSRGRTSQSCTTRKPKYYYYYYSPFSLIPSTTKQQKDQTAKC